MTAHIGPGMNPKSRQALHRLGHFPKTDIRFWQTAVFHQPYFIDGQRLAFSPGMACRWKNELALARTELGQLKLECRQHERIRCVGVAKAQALLEEAMAVGILAFPGNVHHMDRRFEKLAGTNALSSSRHISLKSRKGSSAPLSIMARTSGSVLFGKK